MCVYIYTYIYQLYYFPFIPESFVLNILNKQLYPNIGMVNISSF